MFSKIVNSFTVILVATVTKLSKTGAIQWFTFDTQLQIALNMTETRRKM